jgi:RimJ/RimL family protein N-acetyltransferase
LPTWWGPRGTVEAEITMAIESESALCRMLARDAEGAPIGYVHAVDLALWGSEAPPGIPAPAYDLDVFVAESQARAQDATEALRALVAEVFATSFAMSCCALISVRNEAAARAYEKAGFRWREIWHDRIAGPCWVLIAERPA